MNTEECLICKAPLEYLVEDELMECAICHKKEPSKTRCVNGHYVCSDCHTQGLDSIFGLCLAETSKDPVAILRRMMDMPFCHMHGPEHLGVEMERTAPVCTYSSRNNQCIGKGCPFSAADRRKPKVAFLCVHNSCRSQMAEALGKQLAGDVFESFSAGTEPGDRINPDAVRLMKQVYGIDMEQTQHNKPLSDLPPVDIVVTMGCNVQCPTLPCSHREDWGLDDPSGGEDQAFLTVMARIQEKVLDLKRRIQAGELE